MLLALIVGATSTALRAQDAPGDYPTGPSGDFNGEVATAGSYDPFTQNAKREITDLVVPGSNGTYPLAFTRIYNSDMQRLVGEYPVLGDGGNWRHSYMWALSVAETSGGTATAYDVAYPDGGVITFRPGRSNAPSAEYSTYWRGPVGTEDRLEVASGQPLCLHQGDGGLVYFASDFYANSQHAALIVDPYGAATSLSYNNGYLSQVTEPGGRSLYFDYSTVTETVQGGGFSQNYTWTLLTQTRASTGQSVSYTYNDVGGRSQASPTVVPYKVLTSVTYNSEPKASGSGNVQASYTYEYNGGGVPVVTTAYDPHYAGAMIGIRYLYTSTGSGLILEEQNIDSQQRVSNLNWSSASGPVVTTETRGDKASGGGNIQRIISYREPSVNGVATNTTLTQLTSYSDFEGHRSYLTYYPAGDGNGVGNFASVTDPLGHTTRYGHEPYTGKVTSITFPDGRTRSWSWRSKDNTTTQQPYYLYQYTDERSQSTYYKRYSNTGLVSEIDYPDGSSEQFVYSGFDGPNGKYWKLGYQKTKLGAQMYYNYGSNPNHYTPSGSSAPVADLLTSVVRYYNDGGGNMRSETTTFQYDAYDRPFLTTDPGGVATRTVYNARHQLVQTTHMADNASVNRWYDDLGNCTDVQDEMGHTVHTTYDTYRRVLQMAIPINDGSNSNRYQTFAYDPRDYGSNSLSSALSHTRAQWSVSWRTSTLGVERVFSPNGWLKRTYNGIVASGDWTQGTVTVGGGPGCVYDYTDYSSIGQVLSYQDTQGQNNSFAYSDPCGRKTAATDPNGHVNSYAYYLPGDNANFVGWPKSVTVPGPDINANNGTVTTRFTDYDVNGHVKSTIDPFNHTFVSGYDPTGNLTAQSDGDQAQGQHNTGYGYDQLGRKVSVTNPATGTQETWTYDASGNVKTYKNYAGNTCTYQYDGRNRCYRYDWDDGVTPPTGYGYDAAGRVTEIDNWHVNIHYTLNDAGEVMSEQQTHNDTGVSGTTHYYRDNDGNIVGISYPSGFAPQFAYDWQARCTGVYSGNYTFSHYTFYGNWLSGRAMGNGLCTTYGYQPNGRVTDVWHRHGDLNSQNTGNNVRRFCYGYEPNGQISWFDREADNGESGSSLETGQGDAFRYDPDGSLNLAYRNVHYNGSNGSGPYARNNWPYGGNNGDSQLYIPNWDGTGATADTYGNSYSYDGAGNRVNFTYKNQAQPGYSVQGDNKYNYSAYDANNNTTDSCVGWQYKYDAENHLTNAYGPNGQSATFLYDGLGRLCVQSVNGAFKRFYYVGSQRGEERDYNNNPLENYMYDAPGSDRILYRQGQYGGFWYQYDLMGNTSHVSDGNGNVVEQYLYDAYGQPSVYDGAGNARPSGSAIDNRYLFKGAGAYEWIAPMATYYARARFYLPFHGRWLQPDPVGQAGGPNLYTYCSNDPVNRMDVSGLKGYGIGGAFQVGAGPGYSAGSAQLFVEPNGLNVANWPLYLVVSHADQGFELNISVGVSVTLTIAPSVASLGGNSVTVATSAGDGVEGSASIGNLASSGANGEIHVFDQASANFNVGPGLALVPNPMPSISISHSDIVPLGTVGSAAQATAGMAADGTRELLGMDGNQDTNQGGDTNGGGAGSDWGDTLSYSDDGAGDYVGSDYGGSEYSGGGGGGGGGGSGGDLSWDDSDEPKEVAVRHHRRGHSHHRRVH